MEKGALLASQESRRMVQADEAGRRLIPPEQGSETLLFNW